MRYKSLVSCLCVLLAMVVSPILSVVNAQKISDLPNFTGVVSDSDLFPMVDVSDTGISSSGTTKKITALNSKAWLKSYFDTLYLSSFDYAPVDTEAELAAAISASTPVIMARANITFTGNHTLAIGQTYSALPGAIITTNGNVFDLSYGYLEDNGGQMFNSSPNEVEFGQYPTINPRMFGSGFNGTTDDANAWQCALDAFPATGGKLTHDGVSLIASDVIWPNDGTYCYPIVLEGNITKAQTGNFNTVTGGGGGQIKYTGTGTAFDLRNGDGSNLTFLGAIKNIRLSGPYTFTAGTDAVTDPNVETNEGTIGIDAYKVSNGAFDNTVVLAFGYGIKIAHFAYYSKLSGMVINNNKYGLYTTNDWNGLALKDCQVSSNKVHGVHAEYFGDLMVIDNSKIELNGQYADMYSTPLRGRGIHAAYGQMIAITNGTYFENNGANTGGDSHVRVVGDGFYSTVVSITNGTHFSWSKARYIISADYLTALTITGCNLQSYQGATAPATIGYQCQFVGAPIDMMIQGNEPPVLNRTTDTVTEVIHFATQALLAKAVYQDALHPGITMDRASDGAGYVRAIPLSHIFLAGGHNITNSGGIVGWQATEPGAGAFADLNGVEPGDVQPDVGENYSLGSIDNASQILTVVGYDSTGTPFATAAHKTDLMVGCTIQIDTDGAVSNGAFVPATFSDGTDYATIVRINSIGTSNCVVTLDKTLSSATVTGGLLRYNLVARSNFGGRVWYKSKTSVSSSGTGEDSLMVATTLTAAMLKADSTIPILARGTITGTAGNHTLKIYLGATAFTILSGTTTEGAWRFQGEIQVTAAAAQTLSGLFWNADGVAYIETSATEAISGALALKMTGECANGADTITQSLFVADLK